MQNRFNLVDEPWIPVVDMGPVSLKTLFSNPEICALSGTPPQKIVLMKLLLAICQTTWTPKDKYEWHRDLTPEKLAQCVLVYLERWRDRFWLYGERPFLQMPAISAAQIKPFATVMADVATGNTTLLTEYHQEKPLSDGQKALLLVEQMSMALGGKKADNSIVLSPGFMGKMNHKGKPSTSRPGSAVGFMGLLHSFALGNTLWETLWFNILTLEDLKEIGIYDEGLGHPPWENMPEGEDCPVACELQNSLMGRLVPMCRFILLTEQGLHLSEGIQHLGYKEGMHDPSITLRPGEDKKAVWVDPEIRPWRELPALLGFLSKESNTDKTSCQQLNYALTKAKISGKEFGIWTGGIRVSSNAGEQYVSGKDDIVESSLMLDGSMIDSDWFNIFKTEMLYLNDLSKTLYSCITGYFSEFMKAEDKGKYTAIAYTQQFWKLCELQVQHLFHCCKESCITKDHLSLALLQKTFFDYVVQLYSEACTTQNARQISAWAKHFPFDKRRLGNKPTDTEKQQNAKTANSQR